MFGDRVVTAEERTMISQQLHDIIANKTSKTITDLIFVPSVVSTMVNDQETRTRKYDPYETLDAVRAKIGSVISQLADTGVKAPPTVMFDAALLLLLHTTRVLSLGGGCPLIVGGEGSGRHQIVRIAALMMGHHFHYLNTSNRSSFQDDLKNLYKQAAVNAKSITLLMALGEAADDSVLDLVSSIVAAGEVPGLFNTDEMELMVSDLISTARRTAAHPIDANDAAKKLLVERARDNLHIAICVSPGAALSRFSSRFPVLYSECSMLWVSPWLRSALQLSAEQDLRDVPLDPTAKANLVNMLTDAHCSAESITSSQGRGAVTVTPAAFRSLLQRYETSIAHLSTW